MRLGWVVGAVVLMVSREAGAQTCTADIDCDSDKICVDGTCALPPPKPEPRAKPDEPGVNVTYADEPAEAARLPVRFVSRPITLPNFVLRPAAGLSVIRFAFFDGTETVVQLGIGASFGLFDDLELGIVLLPIILSPDFDYGDIPVVARYRFLDGDVELGAELTVFIPTNTDFGLTPGFLARFHVGDLLSLDTGVFFPIRFFDPDTSLGTTVDLSIPLRLNIQIIDMLFAGVETGFGMGLALGNAGDFISVGDTVSIPLGFSAGFTLPSDEGPMFDIIAGFSFPSLIHPAADDKIITEIYVFNLSFLFHIFL